MKWRYLSIAIGIILLYSIDWGRALKDHIGNGFQDTPPRSELHSSSIRFREVAKERGLDFLHREYFPNTHISASALTLLAIYPSTSVYDVDDNGEPDVLFTDAHPDGGMKLFLSERGQFRLGNKEYGIDEINRTPGISRAIFADLNEDGFVDLIVARFGCHDIYLGQGPRKPFKRVPNALNGYCSAVVGLNVGDFDRDGHLDIFFSAYWKEQDFTKALPRAPRLRSSRLAQPAGNRLIMRGRGDGTFEMTDWLDFLPRSYSNTGGIADIDGDGWLDLYIANDYSFDFLVLNNGDIKPGEARFRDVTDQWAPKESHGLNGMNADFGDFNRDGKLDLYVSNISAPPYVSFNNVLWQNDGTRFRDQSRQLGVAHCGWSWGGKWADFDNDGQLDLAVANGRARGPGATQANKDQVGSLRNARALGQDVPAFMRRFFPDLDYPSAVNRQLSGFARSCLFRQNNGKFWDVAQFAGVTDLEEGYGLATLDLDSDGRIDFVVSDLKGPAVLYHNETLNPTAHWIGFVLRGPEKMRDPYGATVEILLANGKKLLSLFYPTNGFNSQSDPRIHFGLSSEDIKTGPPKAVRIKWPTRKGLEQFEVFTNFEMEKYNLIKAGTGIIE
jgi:enediyne biosynthesis protein E4